MNDTKCDWCGGPIRLVEGHWVHTAPDYDPFEEIHPPRPKEEKRCDLV